MIELPQIHTACVDCVFADWDDIKGKKTQIGCKVGRLDKFVKRGENMHVTIDEPRFYIIEDRVCLMCCKKDWLEKNPDIKNPAVEMRKRATLKCTAYVLAGDEHSLEASEITIKTLIQQNLKPTEVKLIVCSDKIQRFQANKMLKDLGKQHEFQWSLTNILDRGVEGEQPSFEWCVDHVVPHCKTMYYCVFKSGFEVPNTYLLDIDHAINDEMEKFCALIPINDWDGTFVHVLAHKKVQGNLPMYLDEANTMVGYTVVDKIKYYAEQENKPFLFERVEEVCPAMYQQ